MPATVVFTQPHNGHNALPLQATAQPSADFDAGQALVVTRASGDGGGGLLVVQGLSGSGKTHAIAGTLAAVSAVPKNRVLVCCGSDAAAERLVLLALAARGAGKKKASIFRVFDALSLQVRGFVKLRPRSCRFLSQFLCGVYSL